jgi:hypothetical protein
MKQSTICLKKCFHQLSIQLFKKLNHYNIQFLHILHLVVIMIRPMILMVAILLEAEEEIILCQLGDLTVGLINVGCPH